MFLIMIIIVFLLISLILIQKTKSLIYNLILSPYTTKLNRYFLDYVKKGIVGYDIGIGTGKSLLDNSDLIKKKEIKIIGYDIDPIYIKDCRRRIENKKLEKFVKVKLMNIYEERTDLKVDFVFFSDSYAVIPNVHKMINHCKKFLNKDGRIYIITTLNNHKDYTLGFKKFLKPKLKYLCSVEFGKITTIKEFKEKIKKDWKIVTMNKIYDQIFPIYGRVETFFIELKY